MDVAKSDKGAVPAEIEIDYMELDRIIDDEYHCDKENLIMILQAIQRRYNYVPRRAMEYLSEKINVPYSRIYGVGTFYSTFSLEREAGILFPSVWEPPAMCEEARGCGRRLKIL